MKRLLFIAIFIFLNACSFNINSKYWNEKSEKKNDNNKEKEDETTGTNSDDDEFNPTLAAMEEEIKPKILKTINILSREYGKLGKYQIEKLNSVLNATEFSKSKEKNYLKICDTILENIKSLNNLPIK